MGLILLVVLILILLGSFPTFPHSRNWGYRPTGVISLLLIVLLLMLIFNVLPWGFGVGGPAPLNTTGL